MGVKVVPFILFVLAGECLSSLTEHQQQVQDVLEKMYHKITGIDEKLSKIEKRVTDLENSHTTPMENKPTNLENAMRNLGGSGRYSYRSLDTMFCGLKKCGEQCTVKSATNEIKPGVIRYKIKHGLCNDDGSCKAADTVKCHDAPDIIDIYPYPCENKKCGEQCTVKGETKEIKPGEMEYLIKHGLCNDDGSCKATDTVKCFLDKEVHVYRSLDETKKLCFNHTELCNDEDLPDQCSTYNTLTNTNRLTARVSFGDDPNVYPEPDRLGGDEKMSDHSGDPNQSEEWQGEGWYRFKNGEPGIRMAAIHEQMATKADENCGANNGAYWNTEVQDIPNGFGENKDSRVKFGSDIKDMKVTNCGRFFVYFLPNAPPDYGYCFVRVTMKDFEENVEVYSD